MTWFSYLVLAFSMAVFALAWLKGGHPERFGALLMSTAYLVAAVAPPVVVAGGLMLFDAIADAALLAVFLWMSLKGDRWWPFLAAAAMVLTGLVHAAMILIPELDTRADLSARLGLTLLTVLALLAGVGERWLAGERPFSNLWKPRPATSHQTLNI
ncbi:hypothetical protein [Brevundimonas sp.]|uniref:hypothetical protein n=1 Tax=Brevundimonas sp. TaxID=1871086 RepID=UPI003F6F2FC4